MSHIRVGAVAAVVVLVLTVSACGQSATSVSLGSKSRHAQNGPALVGVTGGTVTVALDEVPATLNDHTPAGDTPDTKLIASAIWPQVFQVAPGDVPMLDTNVVQSAELVSVNPQTVVYDINPRATWSDGVPISVDDFVYAWQSQRGGTVDVDGSPDSVESTLGYRDIGSVTGSNDGRTVTVVFRSPFGDWVSLFDDLIPAHVAERVGWNHGFDTFDPSVLVSGGPWQVEAWQPGVNLVLSRNPRWWGPLPHLDRIVFRAAPTPTELLSDLRSGTAQVGYPAEFNASLLAALTSSQSLETEESLGTTVLELVFNMRTPPLDNVAVRQGIAHVLDRAGIASHLIQPLNPSAWEDNNHLFANVQPEYNDDASGYVHGDPAAAERLLTQGGLVADTNGTWTFHGTPLVIHLTWATDDPWSESVEPTVASQLVAGGFGVSLEPVTSSQLSNSVLPGGSFDLALVPFTASAYPSATAAYYSSAPTLTTPGTNLDWSGFSDPRVDALFTDAIHQLGTNLSGPIYQQVDQELWAEMPTLPLFAEPTLLVNSAWVNGVANDSGGLGPMFSASEWYRLAAGHRKGSST